MGWKLLFSLPFPCPTLITFALVISKITSSLEFLLLDFIALKVVHVVTKKRERLLFDSWRYVRHSDSNWGFCPKPITPSVNRGSGKGGAHAVSFLGV